ncbi:hypothetical protein CC86DRAFT_365888 [Ophiobolus disseminans]|uniref:Uncharacterized protein n=1 Tax=Ophiobolus disseminans TaxID=1469910 RepID=A0A6A7AF92_9PLEO|nr:hypothetical protein CC86DRAFT_365888 [Ophiobolus disseminans]
MGNNQSSSNHHNRLSKPKTNTNSPSPPLVVESPVSVSSRYADLSAKGRQQIKETLLSPVDTEHGTTAWRKGEDAVGELGPRTRGRPASVISRSNSRTNSRSNSLSCFGSRQGSSTKLTDLHGSKISLVSNTNTHADLEAAIRLLQEVKKNASPEELAALHEALETASSDPPVSVAEQGLSRRTSVANGSCSSLTRRRSLIQTPGLATRTSPVDGRRKTWNSWKAPKIAPDEEAKWAVSPKGITPINRTLGRAEDSHGTSTPRAQTPGEMDYSHLGSLKLGTLSIVNGAPSPVPSARVMKQRARLVKDDDYFSTAEAGSSSLMMKTTKRGHVKSKSSVLPATAPLYDTIPEPQRKPPAPPMLNYGNCHGTRAHAELHTQSGSQQQLSSSPNPSAYPVTNGANKYAQAYQAYIPYSPFANATTFDREGERSRSDEATGGKEEAARILAGTIFDAPTTAIETSGSSLFNATSPISAPKQQLAKSDQRPAPRTADSGYSSGGSFRTGSRSRQSAISSTSSMASRSGKDGEHAMAGPGLSHKSVSRAIIVEPAVVQAQEAKVYRQPPPPLHIPSQSGRSSDILSPTSTRSAASGDSSSSLPKRLQRRRPSQSELPVVQSCQSIPENIIPDIPNNVRDKFTRRLSHTPGMECLMHTYPSKNHVTTTESKDDSASDTPDEAFTQLTELEPERPPTPPAHGRRRSLSLFRRKSTAGNVHADKEDREALPGVVDLGSIATSLGSSPYDAAMSRPQRRTVASPTHPHQLGATLPRAKSMVSMDSQAAAELARMRSRDRAPVEPVKTQQQQRRRSYHNLKTEVGEVKASKRRPQSSLYDIPPVPTIDSSMIKAPLSAKPRLENGAEQISNLGFGARSNATDQAVSQRIDRHDQNQAEVDWDAHSRLWRQRRKSIGAGLRTNAGFGEASASTVNSRNMPPPRENKVNWDRYSGGLEYNYEGRGNISGSAGTRHLHSAASSKSLKWRNQYGVDLSDVPIMLQRA